MSSIKTNFEMPRGDDPVKQAQRLSQDLSSNFKAINTMINSLSSNSSTGSTTPVAPTHIDLVFSFTSGSPLYQSITLAHNLGVIPTGWYIIDAYRTGLGVFSGYSVLRTSWDATNLTLQNMVNMTNVLTVRVFI